MTKWTLALCFALAAPAYADHHNKAAAGGAAAAGAAAAEPGSEKSCGQMIAEKAAMPEKMSEFMNALADTVDSHIKWMEAHKTKEAKKEADALKKLSKSHRDLAKSMAKTAADMKKMADLPPAQHDMTKMDPKMGELMVKQVGLEKEMAGMLAKDAAETEAMMKKMPK